MSPLRVAVVGCTGRMGRTLLTRIAGDSSLSLAAAVTMPNDPAIGEDAGRLVGLHPCGVAIRPTLDAACDVAVEFTLPAGCVAVARWCTERRIPLVSGTTGLEESHRSELERAAGVVPIVWAPNMSVGINLMLQLVKRLSRQLDGSEWDIEIAETHHRRKVDAPSGTAHALLNAAAAGRDTSAGDVARHGRHGETGTRPAGEVGVHALRMGSVVGEHEVHFASESEVLTLRHRAFSRETFADGALRAARWVQGRSPGLYGMVDVLGG